MTDAIIARLRLLSQQVAATQCTQPAEIVAHLLAMQAQDYAGGKWAIGLRLPGSTDKDIEKALAEKRIVRTWPMRGTLHFMAAEDVRWMLSLLTPRILNSMARRERDLELDNETYKRCRELLAKTLQGGKVCTRTDIMTLFEHAGISTKNQRGYHILLRLGLEQYICFGPVQGKQQTFVLLDDWVPKQSSLPREEALAKLAGRYFTGHGPATVQDLAWWAGVTLTDARLGLSFGKDDLVEVMHNERSYWMSRELDPSKTQKLPTRLLATFEEFLLGYKDRSAALAFEHATKVNPGANGMFGALVVDDGQVIGTWKRVLKKDSVVVTPVPFTTFTIEQKNALGHEVVAYASFLGLDNGFLEI